MAQMAQEVTLDMLKFVLHESKRLHDHMNKNHGITLATYEEKHHFPTPRDENGRWCRG